ncbi:30S ribosome-binding factor RbfA [bacterium]|nr:MAG: 30S ribosome-binding factor RbfA [bacterium]
MGRDGHLEETLRRIIASALQLEVEDPRVGFVTVSEVRLNRDRTVAQVFYTVLGEDEDRKTSLEGLKRCRGFLRQIVGDQIRLRMVPELRFVYDESLDRSFRLEETFDRIAKDREAGGAAAGDSSTGPAAETGPDETE